LHLGTPTHLRWTVRGALAGLVGSLVLLAVAPAGAATSTVYVDGARVDCSDSGPGTQDQPLCSISAAAARAPAGTTLQVSAGTYDESVVVATSGTAAEPVVFTAEAGESVILSGGVHGFDVASRSWVVITGFDIRDTTSTGIRVTGSSNVSILANEVSGAGTPVSGSTAKGIAVTSTTSSTVAGNDTHDNSDAGIYVASTSTGDVITQNRSSANAREYTRAAAGIDVRSPGNEVSANVTFDNEDSGINLWNGATGSKVFDNLAYGNGDHGIDNKSSNDTDIVANTVTAASTRASRSSTRPACRWRTTSAWTTGSTAPARRGTSGSMPPPPHRSPSTTTWCTCPPRA